MAFDKTQPFSTVNTDAGKIYYLQAGVLYNSFDLSVASSPTDAPNVGIPPWVSGGIPASLATLISGEDQTNNWLKTSDGGQQYYIFSPAPNAVAGGAVPLSDQIVGTVGSGGDYLKSIVFKVDSATNAAVFLQDGNLTDPVSGTTGTDPAGTTTVALTASASFSATANQYRGFVLLVTYTPTGSAGSVTVPRKIVTHAAVSASTAVSFVVTHNLPAGATVTAWSVLPLSAREILPFNAVVGTTSVTFGKVSTNGGWRISVDSGVQVECIGKFT